MHYPHLPHPETAKYFDSQTIADVLATAAGATALNGDANRIGAWFALQTPTAIAAAQFVYVCVTEGGKLRAVATIGLNNPYVYLKLCDYGSVIFETLTLVSPSVNQTVSCGQIRRTFYLDDHVDKAPSGNVPKGVGHR